MKTDASAVDLLWSERALPKRGPRPTLTLPMIAGVGIALADEGGLAAVTMEAVAQQLGLTKMALYRYVPGKAELVALMVEEGLGAPNAMSPRKRSWRAGLRVWARELFAKFHAHPWALEATLGQRLVGPKEMAWLEAALAALAGTGLRGADKLDVVVTVLGHVRYMAQVAPAITPPNYERTLLDEMRGLLEHRAQQFPELSAVLSERSTKTSEGAAFEFGLERIFDGVEAFVAKHEGQRRR